MDILQDARVKRDRTVSDEAYEVTVPDGIWYVFRDDAKQFLAAPPKARPEGWHGNPTDEAAYDAWVAGLPRFGTAADAVADVLNRY